MGVDKFNHEGYFDPTTYEALTNIHREEMATDKKRLPIFLWCMCAVRMQVMLKTTWQMYRGLSLQWCDKPWHGS